MALAPVGITFVSKGVNNLVRDLENVRKQLNRYGNTAQAVAQQARTSAAGVRAMNRAMGQANGTVTTTTNQVANLRRGFGALATAAQAPSTAISALGKSTQRLGFQIGDVGRRLTQAGVGLTAFVTLPVTLGLNSATQAAIDFETELIKLNTQIGLNEQQVQFFNDAILGIGQSSIAIETATDSAELAGSAFTIASAGIRDSEIALELLTQSAKAARLGLGDTADISRTVAGALQAFTNEGLTASTAVDILLATVREGNLEADKLAGQFGKVGGLASSLGVQFADASAFVAAFTRSGASASEAMTSLRSVLTTIAKDPGTAANEALAGIGLTIEDVRESIADPNRGLNATLIELRQRFEENGESGVEFFRNIRAFSGFSFVTGIPEELEKINVAIRNSEGVVDQGFSTIQQTTGFQLEQFRATINVLAVTIGNVLLPVLNAALQRILPFIEAIRAWAAENPRFVQIASIFALIAAAIGPLVIALGTLGISIGGIVGAVGAFISVLGAVLSPIGLVVTAIVGLATAIGGPLLLGLAQVSGFFDQTFSEIATNMFAWGREVVVQFARGMIAGLVAVVEALNTIGRTIAFWLQPGSPPRLIPDIDQWGTAAMNEFLKGFTLANFDTFDAVADITERVIRAGVDEITEGTIQGISEFRERIASAVSQISSVNTDGGFLELAESIGFANEQLTQYTATMFQLEAISKQVANAQREIEQINQDFTQAVAPLNAELEAIEARRDEVRRAQRVEELQGILDDESAPELAKELALLELREFELQDQIKAEEDLRDAALEEAQAKLDALEAEQAALEEQAELQLRVIEAQLRQNELLGESTEAIEELTGAIGRLGDAFSSAGGGLGGIGFGELDDLGFEAFDLENTLGDLVGDASETLVGEFDDLFAELQALVQPLIDKFLELRDTWAEVAAILVEGDISGSPLALFLEDLEEFLLGDNTQLSIFIGLTEDLGEAFVTAGQGFSEFGQFTDGTFSQGLDSVLQLIGRFIIAFTNVWLLFTNLLLAPFIATIENLPEVFGGLFTVIEGLIVGDGERVIEGFRILGAGILQTFVDWILLVGEIFGVDLQAVWDNALLAIATWGLNVLVSFNTFTQNLVTTVQQLWFLVKFHTLLALLNLSTFFTNFIDESITNFTNWKDETVQGFIDWKDDSLEAIGEFFTNAKEDAQTFISDIIEILGDRERLVQAGKDLMNGFKDGILSLIGDLVSAAFGVVDAVVDAVNDRLGNQSPSKVMRAIGRFAGQGLALGIADTTSLVTQASASLGSVVAPAVVSSSTVNNNAEINMGGVEINNGMDEIIFEAAVRRILTQALGETL